MKVLFEKAELLSAVSAALGSVSAKNTISAIEGIHFVTEGDSLCTLVAYDLEKGIKTTIGAKVEEPGDYIINAGKLMQILRLLPDGTVTISITSGKVANISSGKSEFELYALDGKEFPSLPELLGETGFSVPQHILRKMISQITFAIAQNDSRAALNGAYFEISGDKIKIVSCDGNRLAIKECVCVLESHSQNNTTDFRFIVPGKALSELMKLMQDTEDAVKIVFGRKHAIFEVGKVRFFCRLIDGEYIEYERFIPRESHIFSTISTESFVDSLERAALITEDRTVGQAHSIVKCNFTGDILQITSQSVSGRVYDEIPIEKEGADLEIGFNCKNLMEAMRSCMEETVVLQLTSAQMCMSIQPKEQKEGETFLFLVVPVRMKK